MKQTKNILFAILSKLIFTLKVLIQNNQKQILAIRNASNLAFKSNDHKQVLSYLTDDVLTTTGDGTLLCGKKALEQSLLDAKDSKVYFIRTPKEVVVNEKRGTAWEIGNWDGYNPKKGDDSTMRGNYSAMWSKESGIWKIKSQLFVTID